ncbi:MAG: hypothetical protein JXD22_01505 [Sedimentisphaerales bacterium]|nr:hypothetical protein [Sedimentisphaerales bacterium]
MRKLSIRWFLLQFLCLIFFYTTPALAQNTISLEGNWAFQLDPDDVGAQQQWFTKYLADTVQLPGTTDLNHRGPKTTEADQGNLTRQYEYVGPAWYQRQLDIPTSWQGKTVNLLLERCLWQTTVWLDNKLISQQNSLTTPHLHELGRLQPGRHRLTIRVDNSLQVNIGTSGHSYTKHTQSIWNGIVGRIELQAHDPVWITQLQIFPDVEARTLRILVTIGNETGKPVSGKLSFQSKTDDGRTIGTSRTVDFTAADKESLIETVFAVDRQIPLWDEFTPTVYTLAANLQATTGAINCADTKSETFGFRNFTAHGRQILVNGRPTFLRGTLECCVFPLTGHPPADQASWDRICGIVKSYGMNHIRFHSWCPPEAAFIAADQAGIYLQVETPYWIDGWMTTQGTKPKLFGQDPGVVDFIRAELDRILQTYGNHPSFCMLAIGNEIGNDSDYDLLASIIAQAQQKDSRHLYSVSTARKMSDADEFLVTHYAPGGSTRGVGPAHTDWDFTKAVNSLQIPLISHENGQWVVYPDYSEIAKYTGPLKPRNYEIFRDTLAAHGMADQNLAFQQASGAFALLLYKQELEAIQRTSNYSGYQLLMLHDFPGQGEALVGLLDAFFDSKGIVEPKQFRQFCNQTVPILRFPKYTWTANEKFQAQAQIAHYGPHPLPNAECSWSARNDADKIIASGTFDPHNITVGQITTIGQLSFPLASCKKAQRLRVQLQLKNTPFSNEWTIWVYPQNLDVTIPEQILISESFDDSTRQALTDGKKVLLFAHHAQGPLTIANRFMPVYWSYGWFHSGPGTLGLLCDPAHPSLANFPTQFHSDWQWRQIAQDSKAFILNETPPAYRPLVQPIDDFHRNHKLGSLFETQMGPGKLLICGYDLRTDLDTRPVARQMLFSLLAYMQSKNFNPKFELDPDLLKKMLTVLQPAPVADTNGKFNDAMLNIKAAANVPELNQSTKWNKSLDLPIVVREGFNYRVQNGTAWRDDSGSAWPGNPLSISLNCPKGTQGTLYVHFHDWNNLNRRGRINFEGNQFILGDHTGTGRWIALDFIREDTLDNTLQLNVNADAGPNIMITQIVLVPKP